MRALSASELLRIWEQGREEPSYRRALLLLVAACAEQSSDELAKLSIGRRDALLLTLREWTFGPRMTSVSACPACGDRLESNIDVADIRVAVSDSTGDEFQLTLDDYQVDFRLPCTVDLNEASSSWDKENMNTALIRRCISNVRRHDEEIAADQLPVHVVEAVVARMAERDPQADTQLSFACPGCSHRWNALFDIVSFFWSEIHTWAMRILREVHLLASAYGWREEDILAMSPLRRRLYLEMVGV